MTIRPAFALFFSIVNSQNFGEFQRPLENLNLVDKTAEMKAALSRWQSDTSAQNPVPNPDFDPGKRYEWGKHPDRK